MGVLTLPATIERGLLRAFVPFAMEWPCGRCGRSERAEGVAMADTGAPSAAIPSAALPVGHVAFDDLPAGGTIRTIRGATEYRYWDATITVMGVPIAGRWKVYEGILPDFPLLGVNDLFSAFRVGFDLGASPPTFSLEPYADRTGRNLAPLRLQDLNVVDYGDQAYRLSADLRRFGLGVPALSAAAQRLQIAAPRPSRQQRRHATRKAT